MSHVPAFLAEGLVEDPDSNQLVCLRIPAPLRLVTDSSSHSFWGLEARDQEPTVPIPQCTSPQPKGDKAHRPAEGCLVSLREHQGSTQLMSVIRYLQSPSEAGEREVNRSQ